MTTHNTQPTATRTTMSGSRLRELERMIETGREAYRELGFQEGIIYCLQLLRGLQHEHLTAPIGPDGASDRYHLAAITTLSNGIELLNDAREQAYIDVSAAIKHWGETLEVQPTIVLETVS